MSDCHNNGTIRTDNISSMDQKLINSALWLIIDPWQHQIQHKPDGMPRHQSYGGDQYLNVVNHYFRHKILLYLTHWAPKHLYVSSPSHIETGHEFKDIPVLRYTDVEKKVVEEKFTEIVYTGFHYGRCINNPPQGIKHMHQFAKCYIVKDLVCLFPSDNWIQMDNISKQWAEII